MTRDDVIRSTAEHILKVGMHLSTVIHRLALRAVIHDASKWSPEEWPAFEEATPKLAGTVYGSDEYKAILNEIRPAVDIHQARNSHHPEHYIHEVNGMNLLDLLEMLCDWRAAGERNKGGNIYKSLIHNRERFYMSNQLYGVLWSTARELFPDVEEPTNEL